MTLYHRAADMLERYAAWSNTLRICDTRLADVATLIAELRAAAQQSALDELVRENERLGLYEPPSEPAVPKRDRKADRARFHDPAFNRWLDEGISDAGHTVWDQIESVIDAWHGWDNRQFYATSRADPPLEPTRIFSSCPALVAADAIAGALYDFLGYLTTRDETLCMGATQCSPVVPALQAWAKTRNLPLDEANVKGWRDSIATPAPALRAAGDELKPCMFCQRTREGESISALRTQLATMTAERDAERAKVAALREVTTELEVTIRVMGLYSEPLARMADSARNAMKVPK